MLIIKVSREEERVYSYYPYIQIEILILYCVISELGYSAKYEI